jgi:hypothetical protein
MISGTKRNDRSRKSTTAAGPEYKQKNSEGRSYRHVKDRAEKSDSGAGTEDAALGKRLRGARPGPGKSLADASMPAAFMAKNVAGSSFRNIEPRGPDRKSGGGKSLAKVSAWVNGKAKSYC